MNGDPSPDEADPGTDPDPDTESDTEPDRDDELAERWAAYEVPERSRTSVVITWAVVLGVVAALVGAGFVVRSQWHDWTGCRPSDERVIDEASRLCYENPDGWPELTEAEIEQNYRGPGLDYLTSGLNSAAEGDPFIKVFVDEYFYADGANADTSLVEFAETQATSSNLMQAITDPEIESEALTVDGYEAATATAFGVVPSTYEEGDGDLQFWVRVTVVDLGDSVSLMYSGATIPVRELTTEGGEVATLDEIHDSITIK